MNEYLDLFEKLTKFIEVTTSRQAEDIKSYIKTEVGQIKETIDEEVVKRKELEKDFLELKIKYKLLEKELRKNNIIICNLGYEEENDILKFTLEKLNQLLDINISKEEINNIYAIGKNKRDRPIIVKFTSYLTKQSVLKNCKKLKGTNISISEELALEERRNQKILRQHLKQARAKKLNAYIKGDNLYINEEIYNAEKLITNEKDGDNELDRNENISENVEIQKSSSAPPTPIKIINNQVELNREEYELEKDENLPKKRKFTNPVVNAHPSRSSPRFNEKETKANKNTL